MLILPSVYRKKRLEGIAICTSTNKTRTELDIISKMEVTLEHFEIGTGEVKVLVIK